MNPWNTCYIFGVGVTHMLGDEHVGVHHGNYDSADSMILCSYLVLFIFV